MNDANSACHEYGERLTYFLSVNSSEHRLLLSPSVHSKVPKKVRLQAGLFHLVPRIYSPLAFFSKHRLSLSAPPRKAFRSATRAESHHIPLLNKEIPTRQNSLYAVACCDSNTFITSWSYIGVSENVRAIHFAQLRLL